MLVVVDTNLWIAHLRGRQSLIKPLLIEGEVLMHPTIYGELALGTYRQRETILDYLKDLPQALVATHDEICEAIERYSLYRQGIGIADTAILCSTLITPRAKLFTLDQRLAELARELGVAYEVPSI